MRLLCVNFGVRYITRIFMEYTVLCLFTTVHVVCFVSKAFMLSYIICKQYYNNKILSANDQILQKSNRLHVVKETVL